MKELAVSLVLLFVISIYPNFCAGLECKQGTSHRGPNNYTHEHIYKDSTCPAGAKYCYAGICTKAGVNAFSRIIWSCADVYNMIVCPRVAKEDAVGVVTVTNFDCKCNYGAEGEDFSNENFEILPIPTSNVLTCKKGAFDSEENGGTSNMECYDYDKYCYIASCAKGNELVRTEWDCSPDTDCTEISAKVGKTVNATVKCECHFGRVNTSLTNENFTRPLLPTTTTDKPTTTMDKPTNTTAEANLGVRAIIPVGSGVLLAIVHVLASVLPKLGVGGQLFNDL